jgi:hypothetical protein
MFPTFQHHKETHRMIIITENNALNQKCKDDFNGLFKSHIDAQTTKDDIDFVNDNIICSLESLNKLKMIKNKPTFLILDEFESIINHFESNKTVKNKYVSYCFLEKFIKNCKCLLLDADISNNRMDWFKSIKEPQLILHETIEPTLLDKWLHHTVKLGTTET